MANQNEGVLDDADSAEGAAKVFKALGDESRLRFLEAIAGHPGICACELLESLELSQSTLSHHMKILCDAGLVVCERNGRWAHYVLSPDGAALARNYLDRLWA